MIQADSSSPGEGQQQVICLMGPTAAGKTGLAVDLVKEFPLEIISVDSALVYRGMDIGTAKPDAQTLAEAPHRLIDICDPTDAYSAARFSDDARREINEVRQAGNTPLLAGGTMLYYRALLEGLSKLPEASPEIRAKLEREAALKGWSALHSRLAELDPDAAGRINPNDPQRIQRALEVIELTGQPMSELQSATAGSGQKYESLKLIISPEDRKILHWRIEERFRAMMADGFVDEVRALRKLKGIHPGLPSLRAVGYRQCWQWLEGELEEEEWQEKAIAATRQLAKRQLTWLRREKQALWYDLSKGGSNEQVFDAVRDFLNRRH